MAYADALRSLSPPPTMTDVAALIEGLFVSGFPLTLSSWTPTFSASGSMTFTGTSIVCAKYIQVGKLVIGILKATGTVGGTPSRDLLFTLPVTASSANNIQGASGAAIDSGTVTGGGFVVYSTTQCGCMRSNAANWTAGAATIGCLFAYEAA